MADEDIVLENSPLQKYLDEIGFTDFEKVKGNRVQEEVEKSLVFSFRTWIKGIFQCFHYGAFKRTWESFLSWFAVTPSMQDLEAFRKDYIVAVAESQVLNEDDVNCLSRFDPELFECRRQRKSSALHKEWSSFLSRRYVLPSVFVLVSAVLVAVNGFVFSSLSVVFVLLFVAGSESLIQYYFCIHHQRNLDELISFTKQIKQLAQLLRKSIKFIQEMEIISKGYTMVGPANPNFFSENDDNFTRSTVYPALRENILTNTEHVATCLQKSAKELLLHFPLDMELANLFTHLSTGDLNVGIRKLVSDGCNERMSLQGLKNMASLVLSLQSEFLSRFLLCLSVKAHGGNLYELYNKLFTNMNKIFRISSKVITASLTSIERCCRVHESCCFKNEELVKSLTKLCTKWTALDTALHSLQLHLQAGILRIQSFQQDISELSKSEAEQELKATNSSDINQNADIAFQWLKSDLESAFTCWQEGERHLNKLLGKEPAVQLNSVSCDTEKNVCLEESKEPCTMDLNEEISESYKIYEAFSEPYDEALFELPALNAEDLETEIKVARENKRLLQELKAVLFTKAKDPLIGTAGFVQPVKSSDTLNVNDDTLHNDSTSFFTEKKETETLNSYQLSDVEASEQPMMLFSNLQSSVADSVAAAAVMRSKTMGLNQNEEIFFGDDSD